MRKQIKRIFSIHHWCGLIAGVFLLVISLSGSILVFHDEIDQALYKNKLTLDETAGALSIDRSFEKVRSLNLGWEIRIPGLPENNKEVLKYELRKKKSRKWVLAHPQTGDILYTIDRADKRFIHVLLTLHYSFFSGTAGKVFVFLCGTAFLVLLLTGMFLYRKALLKVLFFQQRISFKSKKAFYSSLHRIMGVWALAFNMLICVTGLWMANLVITNALKVEDASISTPPFRHHSIDNLLSQVSKQHPEFEVNYIRFPVKAEGTLQLSGRLNNDPIYYGNFYSNIQINVLTGHITKVQLLRDKKWLERFTTILQPLHFGNYAGIWIKIIYTIGGLLPGVLAISGFIIWINRNRLVKRKLYN